MRISGFAVRVRAVLPPAWLVLVVVLLAAVPLKLRHLGHTALTRWDEVFHAVVARNILKHPLRPTLIDVPYLPYDPADCPGRRYPLRRLLPGAARCPPVRERRQRPGRLPVASAAAAP